MPRPVDPVIVKQEKAALDKVKLRSFGATPKSVPTFGATKLSWEVEIPPSDVDITIELNQQTVAAKGTKSLSLAQTTGFALNAVTENTGRLLRRLTVTVDASECKQKLLDAFPIKQLLKTEFDKRFSGSSKFTLRGSKSEVTLGDGFIDISVPLTINVPNWFDAKMDIGIRLSVTGFGSVVVAPTLVGVNVGWSFFEHLASLGCTGFVQSGMEQMAQAFLANIVDAELVPSVRQGLTDEVNKFLGSLTEADAKKRAFAMTFIVLSSRGATITACPKV